MNFSLPTLWTGDHDPSLSGWISASAGAGKTTALQNYVQKLIVELGWQTHEIIVLMFNRAARDEFIERLPEALQNTLVMTFHQLAWQALVPEKKCICEASDDFWWLYLQEVWHKHHLTHASRKELAEFLEHFDRFNNGVSPPAAWEALCVDLSQQMEHAGPSGVPICRLDALPARLAAVWEESPKLAREALPGLRLLLVDEYQDSNPAQQRLLKIITQAFPKPPSVLAVGDIHQSIYGFRGANPAYLLHRMEKDFPGLQRYRLDHSYRYGHRVALMANHLLGQSTAFRRESLIRAQDDRTIISWESHGHGRRGDLTVDLMEASPFSGAILVREFRMTEDIEIEAFKRGISLQLEGRPIFPLRPAGAVIRVLLLLSLGRTEEAEALAMDGLGNAFLKIFCPKLYGADKQVANHYIGDNPAHWRYQCKQWGRQSNKALGLMQRLDELIDGNINAHSGRASDWLNLLSPVSERDSKDIDVAPLWKESLLRISLGITPEGLSFWFESWAKKESSGESTWIMATLHGSKGRGFDHVILVGLGRDELPLKGSDIEEERRLFYVGITRAKKRLDLVLPEDGILNARATLKSVERSPGESKVSQFVFDALPWIVNEGETLAQSTMEMKEYWGEKNKKIGEHGGEGKTEKKWAGLAAMLATIK